MCHIEYINYNITMSHFYFLLHYSDPDPLSVPRLTVSTATSTGVEYRVERNDTATTRVITGYEVFSFGVPMIGEYDNVFKGRTVTISPAVPGAQYRITAWALGNTTRRSAEPAVKSATTRDESENGILYIIIMFGTCSNSDSDRKVFFSYYNYQLQAATPVLVFQ